MRSHAKASSARSTQRMYRRFHDRFGTAGVVAAVIALVVAVSGTAFAAGGGLTSKQKKEVKAIAKSFQGKGPQGAPGKDGANGASGANGANGAPGANGKTVLNGTATPGGAIGTLGDFYIDTDDSKIYGPKAGSGPNSGWGSGTNLKGADGAPGEPWTAGGTLPVGATETGAWSFSSTQAASGDLGVGPEQLLPISFSVPLSAGLDGSHVIVVPGANTNTAHCSAAPVNGTVKNPKAESGYLCVYLSALLVNAAPDTVAGPIINTADGASGSGTAGAILMMSIPAAGDAFGIGSWAVTGS